MRAAAVLMVVLPLLPLGPSFHLPAASAASWGIPASRSATARPGRDDLPRQTVGEIRGRVVDRTAPVHPLAGQVVRLEIVERGSSAERRTVSDGQGRFAFTGLPVGGIRVFLLGTTYRGIPYESPRIALTREAPARDADLVVYEPAGDPSVVRVPLVFGVVDVARGAVRVSVIQRYENPTDRTVAANAGDPLTVPLPRGAEAVALFAGWRDPRVTQDRITDTMPILPGATQVAYGYGITGHGRVVVPWRLPGGAGDVEILVADTGVRVSGEGLRAVGTVTQAGRRFQRWSGGPVPPGGSVALVLDGVPRSGDPWPGALAGALALLLGGALSRAATRGSGSAGRRAS